jgi:hypothetical protein
MTSLASWWNSNWPAITNSLISALIGGAIARYLPTRKEFREERLAKNQRKIDAVILRTIGDSSLWKEPRPVTGAGAPCVRAAEIADVVELDLDTVADSLERLFLEGKVGRDDGTLDDPSPIWHFAPR